MAVLAILAVAPAPVRAGAAPAATPDTPMGFRGDGTGRFPDAAPVTEWSKTKNVVWRTPMPSWSNSQPVVVGQFVFTCSEPATLLCLDRRDGKIVWQKSHRYVDLLSPGDREQAKKDLHMAKRLREIQWEPLKRKRQEVNRNLQGLPKDAFLRSTKSSLQRKLKSLEKKLAALEEHRDPKADAALGHSNCTPVTDGSGLFVLFGNGVGAVYDMRGTQMWRRMIRRPKMHFGHAMSPVLAGKAIVMSIDKEILAVDANTGTDLWTVSAYGPSAGLAAAKVGRQDVVVTAEGTVIRADDGKLLTRVPAAARAPRCAPTIRKDVLYLLGAKGSVLIEMLLPTDDAGVKLDHLAGGRVFEGTYFASPLYHNGCVYLWERTNVLSVISAKNGRRLHGKRLRLGGVAYTSPTLGGKYVFVGSHSGTMAVLEPRPAKSRGGRLRFTLREVARNRLDATRSSPVFAGGHMYLRTEKYLYCIGAKADAEASNKPAPAGAPF